jgi:hypothetical protein
MDEFGMQDAFKIFCAREATLHVPRYCEKPHFWGVKWARVSHVIETLVDKRLSPLKDRGSDYAFERFKLLVDDHHFLWELNTFVNFFFIFALEVKVLLSRPWQTLWYILIVACPFCGAILNLAYSMWIIDWAHGVIVSILQSLAHRLDLCWAWLPLNMQVFFAITAV